jgi:protein transport protein SEC24
LQLSAFHGSFFVRSMDLLVLPNVNPDLAYGIELSMESNLQGNVAYFQTAILHTTAFGMVNQSNMKRIIIYQLQNIVCR